MRVSGVSQHQPTLLLSWLLPVVLIALLAAACSSESTSALVATPAQEAEQGPDVPKLESNSDGEAAASTTTTAPTTTIVVVTTTTTTVPSETEQAVTTTAPYVELVDTGAFEHGPQAHVDFVSSYNGRETEAHQHSSADGVIEHLHSYVIGPESHWHENGKIVYKSNASVFTDDDLTNPDGTGLKGQFRCYPGGCQWLTIDFERKPYLGGTTSEIGTREGKILYTCPVSPVFETEEEYDAFGYEQIQDPEGHGCVPVAE